MGARAITEATKIILKYLNNTKQHKLKYVAMFKLVPWYVCLLMVQWIIVSIPHGGPIELYLIPASAP